MYATLMEKVPAVRIQTNSGYHAYKPSDVKQCGESVGDPSLSMNSYIHKGNF